VTEQGLAIDAVRRLNRARIEYLLTGSMASNYWGIPRTTHDLDFVVQLPAQSIPSLIDEFRDDFYWDSLTPSERQISDAAGVVAVQSDSLDRAYLQQWAAELGVSEKLSKLLKGEIKAKST
jgi:hypothetical protein